MLRRLVAVAATAWPWKCVRLVGYLGVLSSCVIHAGCCVVYNSSAHLTFTTVDALLYENATRAGWQGHCAGGAAAMYIRA